MSVNVSFEPPTPKISLLPAEGMRQGALFIAAHLGLGGREFRIFVRGAKNRRKKCWGFTKADGEISLELADGAPPALLILAHELGHHAQGSRPELEGVGLLSAWGKAVFSGVHACAAERLSLNAAKHLVSRNLCPEEHLKEVREHLSQRRDKFVELAGQTIREAGSERNELGLFLTWQPEHMAGALFALNDPELVGHLHNTQFAPPDADYRVGDEVRLSRGQLDSTIQAVQTIVKKTCGAGRTPTPPQGSLAFAYRRCFAPAMVTGRGRRASHQENAEGTQVLEINSRGRISVRWRWIQTLEPVGERPPGNSEVAAKGPAGVFTVGDKVALRLPAAAPGDGWNLRIFKGEVTSVLCSGEPCVYVRFRRQRKPVPAPTDALYRL